MRKSQRRVADMAARYSLSMDVFARYMDLSAELGEVGKELLQASDYGLSGMSMSAALAGELGDCLFSLLLLGEALKIDMTDSLQTAIKKYEHRWAGKGDIGSGI